MVNAFAWFYLCIVHNHYIIELPVKIFHIETVDTKAISYNLFIVFSPSFASALVVHHHAAKLALMFAGLLPHDGSAGGGGAAGHGC